MAFNIREAYPVPPTVSHAWEVWLAMPDALRAWTYALLLLLLTVLPRVGWVIEHRKVPGVKRVTRLPFGIVVKATGGREREATLLAGQDRTVPVPQIFDSVQLPASVAGYFMRGNIPDEEAVLLVMSHLPGRLLSERLTELTDEQLARLSHQLGSAMHAVRRIELPAKQVCGVGERACVSFVMAWEPFGPFTCADGFNRWMVDRARLRYGDDAVTALPPRPENMSTVFTHGDLCAYNILVDEEGNLSGIIDWETGGYMPEHWDPAYSICKFGNEGKWARMIQQAFEQHKRDVEIEYHWRLVWDF